MTREFFLNKIKPIFPISLIRYYEVEQFTTIEYSYKDISEEKTIVTFKMLDFLRRLTSSTDIDIITRTYEVGYGSLGNYNESKFSNQYKRNKDEYVMDVVIKINGFWIDE